MWKIESKGAKSTGAPRGAARVAAQHLTVHGALQNHPRAQRKRHFCCRESLQRTQSWVKERPATRTLILPFDLDNLVGEAHLTLHTSRNTTSSKVVAWQGPCKAGLAPLPAWDIPATVLSPEQGWLLRSHQTCPSGNVHAVLTLPVQPTGNTNWF